MDQNKVIEKLASIVSKQQTIITKLAQEIGLAPVGETQSGASDSWKDATSQVADILHTIPGADKFVHVLHVSVAGSGALDGRLKIDPRALGTPQFKAVKDALVQALAGKTLDVGGHQVSVSSDPGAINFIAVT
jgi:hypothetical protein